MSEQTTRGSRSAGFSLIELVVVVGIIGVLAAVFIPNLRGYLRTQQIRTAASNFAGDVQGARARAVTKNVNYGVVLVILSTTTYRIVTEDDMDRTSNGFIGTRQAMTALLADPAQVGLVKTLPQGVVFQTTGADNKGIRFNSLGAACLPGSSVATCPILDAGVDQVVNAAGQFKVTFFQASTGLFKTVLIAPGGRVTVEQGYTS